MTRKIPIISTTIVVLAAATMVALGVWQLGRADEKTAMLASYAESSTVTAAVDWPRTEGEIAEGLYRSSSFICERVLAMRQSAARSVNGVQGYAHIANCALDGGGEAEVSLGWGREPMVFEWAGGDVSGLIGPSGDAARLIAMPAVDGLEDLPSPDPGDLPNNHLAYAGQWFFFAITALVIYFLALRRRRRTDGAKKGEIE